MRMIKGVINGILMVTLVRPMVRVMVGRWRKRMQETPVAAIGLSVQELFEAALIEELAPTFTEPQDAPPEIEDIEELVEEPGGRSAVRLAVLAGFIIAAGTAATFAVRELVRRRRADQKRRRDLVAVPIETTGETARDIFQESRVG